MIYQSNAPFILPELPYPVDSLEPFVSARTLSVHREKHHAAYVNNLNNLIVGTEFSKMSLQQIIMSSAKKSGVRGIFNNSAQLWNHSFLWHCMTPDFAAPRGRLASEIERTFGNIANLLAELKKLALGQFGSGWAWLVWGDEGLQITTTSNADLPMLYGQTPLLTVDVWEHAYYLDYQNRRADYLDTFFDKLINWEFASKNLEKLFDDSKAH